MGRLTTHVLDTANGCPASGINVSLYRINGERELISESVTNADGRLDQPLLEAESFEAGRYELVFQAGAYFRKSQADLPDPAFVDDVVLRFGIANPEQHYHVPLLVSPWSYSTYRGS
ncbi:MAG: hydroxyisourate hydrolase [Pseudomonadota bacterium]